MKEFMIICRGDWKKWDSATEAEWTKVMDDYGKWVGKLKKNNRYNRGNQLSQNFKTVNKVRGKAVVTDGPFIETKECLTGFFR